MQCWFMVVRFTAETAPAVLVVLILLADSAPRPAQAQVVAPESEGSDVARLEQRLAANPEDLPAGLQLMAYHQRADRAGRGEDRAKRIQHTLWLIQHHPDSELLHSPVSRFSPGELTPADYRRTATLWNTASRAKPGDSAVQWNAASFFQDLEPELYMHYLEARDGRIFAPLQTRE